MPKRKLDPLPSAAFYILLALAGEDLHGYAIMRRVEEESRSLVIEKRGTPRAVLLSLRDYVRLAAPEPEVLAIIGRESKRRGTDSLTSRQIDRIIKAARALQAKR